MEEEVKIEHYNLLQTWPKDLIMEGMCLAGNENSSNNSELNLQEIEPLLCLVCGERDGTVGVFQRVGATPHCRDPIIQRLGRILQKSVVEIELRSEMMCKLCITLLQDYERLEFTLVELQRKVIQSYRKAASLFKKTSCEQIDEVNEEAEIKIEVGVPQVLSSSKMRIISRNIKEAEKERKFSCSVCGKGFLAFSHRVEHMLTHTGERPFACDQCTFTCRTKSNLRRHKRSHIEHSCTICSKVLCDKISLQDHMKVHINERPYSCEYCDKNFVRASDMKVHRRQHQAESSYKYPCTVCGRRFIVKSRLMRHMAIHSQEKPHKCSFCNKAFVRKDDVKSHERSHKSDKPYLCRYCGKSYKHLSNVKTHMKSHSRKSGTEYSCEVCEISFTSSERYERHQNTRKHKHRIRVNKRKLSLFDEEPTDIHLHDKSVDDIERNGSMFICSHCFLTFDDFEQFSVHTHAAETNTESEQSKVISFNVQTMDTGNLTVSSLGQMTFIPTQPQVVVAVNTSEAHETLHADEFDSSTSTIHVTPEVTASTVHLSPNSTTRFIHVSEDSESLIVTEPSSRHIIINEGNNGPQTF